MANYRAELSPKLMNFIDVKLAPTFLIFNRYYPFSKQYDVVYLIGVTTAINQGVSN